ncbi:MAG: glycosyltransferase family 39 protein, partial [Anaerolineales bacterium]
MNSGSSGFQSLLKQNGILLLLGAAAALFHILFNGQYGFHRDELDILMNARQLDWGYVAYPPITPFAARILLEIFGNSLRGLRLFSALGQGIVVVLAGLMARDLYPAASQRNTRRAEVMSAVAVFIAPTALTAGTMIQYLSFDYLWWVLIAFFFVRLLKTEDPRYWLGVGAAIGMGMLTKFTVIFFVAGLVAAVLLTANRRYLRSPWLWAGAGLALLIYLPNLIWQVQNDFISLDFLSAIHARDIAWGRTSGFLPEQLYISANPFTLPFWIIGLGVC